MFTVTKDFKKLLKKSASMTVFLSKEGCQIDLRPSTYLGIKNCMDTVTSIWYEHEGGRFEKNTQAIFSVSCADDGALPAMYEILKPGDEICFRARTNNNQYQDRANLFNDELCLTVKRKDRVIIKSLVIDSSCCPDNTARAIKAA